jgi:hypothetical protein
MWQTKYAFAIPKNLEMEMIFGRAVKAISSPGICEYTVKVSAHCIISSAIKS